MAVSVYNHAVTNGFSHHEIKRANLAFLHTYVDTVIGYIGDDRALVFEITPKTAQGVLKEYLRSVDVSDLSEVVDTSSNVICWPYLKKTLSRFFRVHCSPACWNFDQKCVSWLV